jgi:hypothetical protein
LHKPKKLAKILQKIETISPTIDPISGWKWVDKWGKNMSKINYLCV